MKSFNKGNVTRLLRKIQDECDLHANHLATKAIGDFGLTKIYMQQETAYEKSPKTKANE